MCELEIVWCDFRQVWIQDLGVSLLTFTLLVGELEKVSIDEVWTLLQLISHFASELFVYLGILRQLYLQEVNDIGEVRTWSINWHEYDFGCCSRKHDLQSPFPSHLDNLFEGDYKVPEVPKSAHLPAAPQIFEHFFILILDCKLQWKAFSLQTSRMIKDQLSLPLFAVRFWNTIKTVDIWKRCQQVFNEFQIL